MTEEKDINTLIGERVRALRLAFGETSQELADNLGLTQSFISNLERGKRSWRIEYIQSVCKHFEISMSVFFDFDGEFSRALESISREKKQEQILQEFLQAMHLAEEKMDALYTMTKELREKMSK